MTRSLGLLVVALGCLSNAGVAAAWPQEVGNSTSTPVFFDLDGDGTLEVIIAAGAVHIYDADGSMRTGWPKGIGGLLETPAIGDLDGDGSPEIAVASGYIVELSGPGLSVLDDQGNTRPGFPVPVSFKTLLNLSNPVIADIDRDGRLDVGVAAELGVHFFDSDGERLTGWPYLWSVPLNNPQFSAPAVGDLDGDGSLEVVVGNSAFPEWGIHVIRSDGTAMAGWPKVVGSIQSSPALADLDENGDLEIIVKTGTPGGEVLQVWNHDGTTPSGWPQSLFARGDSVRSSPAVADVDSDGTLEIVAASSAGRVHVFDPGGVERFTFDTATGGFYSSPAVVDIDGDDEQEVFLTYAEGFGGRQLVSGFRLDGTVLPGFPKMLIDGSSLAASASVHVGDADADGDFELVAAGTDRGGLLWVVPIDPSIVIPGTARSDWPKIRRDAANTGCLCDNAIRRPTPRPRKRAPRGELRRRPEASSRH